MTSESVDVLVVGAGISGIGAAYHLQTLCPERSFAIVEARDDLGGTWDLFRYPGVRSDSDMHTLGYSFRPVDRRQGDRRRADDPELPARDGARARHRPEDPLRPPGGARRLVVAPMRSWTVQVRTRERRQHGRASAARFLFMCSGYYDYAAGYQPDFPGEERFGGRIVHPQQWPEDLDYAGKRVVVIGSGATAVTLVPALAEQAAHVTMLQRSPTWMVARPSVDPIGARLRRRLPLRLALRPDALEERAAGMYVFRLCRRKPAAHARAAARRRAPGARARGRHRHPLHAALQPVGTAPVPGARRRLLRGHQRAAAPRS